MKRNGRESHYAICVNNTGYKASLIVRKVYQLRSDPAAESRGLLRAVDESGEDYLFPSRLLIPIDLPKSASRAFRAGNLSRRSTRRSHVSRPVQKRRTGRATRPVG